jgi:hypothetical protein
VQVHPNSDDNCERTAIVPIKHLFRSVVETRKKILNSCRIMERQSFLRDSIFFSSFRAPNHLFLLLPVLRTQLPLLHSLSRSTRSSPALTDRQSWLWQLSKVALSNSCFIFIDYLIPLFFQHFPFLRRGSCWCQKFRRRHGFVRCLPLL